MYCQFACNFFSLQITHAKLKLNFTRNFLRKTCKQIELDLPTNLVKIRVAWPHAHRADWKYTTNILSTAPTVPLGRFTAYYASSHRLEW